jgi:peptidoglycan/xylan/chitin deacetylase (PgdA/CDA1 family)
MAKWAIRRGTLPLLVAGALALSSCSGGSSPGDSAPGPGPTRTTSTTGTAGPTRADSSASVTPRPTTSPPCTLPASLRGRDVEVLPTSRKVVALTFDAGASDDGVASILATLSRANVRATFFLTGDFVDQFPQSAKAMARYPIGNHTFTHPQLTALTDAGVRTEIRSAAALIRSVTGQDPRPLFRFPYGAVDPHAIDLVNAECYVPFRWTVDTLGWQGITGGRSVDSVVNRVLANARPGEIVLMHVGAHPEDHSTLDADALPRIISGLRAKGYGFVTLEEAVG